MTHKKRKAVLIAAFALLLFVLLLTACQPAPEQSVFSKNDGAFEEAVSKKAEKDTSASQENSNSTQTEALSFEDTVESANGTVKVHIQIDAEDVYSGAFPVVQVAPHSITVEEAKAIAAALFGDAPLYESRMDPPMTAETAEEKLLLWRQLANDEELSALYGEQRLSQAKQGITDWLDYMQNNGSFYEGAEEPVLCRWEFHPESYYSSQEISQGNQETGNQTIIASAKVGNADYKFWLTCRDEEDFRIQNISAYVSSEYSSPWDLETLHMVRTLCKTQKPTEEEFSAIEEKAERMLEKMGLSDDWAVVSTGTGIYKYWKNSETPVYVVNVTAVPSYKGIPCLHFPQLDSLKSDDAYASNYYYSELIFSFSSNGDIIEMNYRSPLEIVTEVNSDVELIRWEEAVECLKNYLRNTEPASFDDTIGLIEGSEIAIEINKIHVGLARVRIKDNQSDFYLVPAIQFSGDYEIMLNGERIYSYSEFYGGEKEFAVINLIDGSIINTKLGY